jgi:hypothetical protein
VTVTAGLSVGREVGDSLAVGRGVEVAAGSVAAGGVKVAVGSVVAGGSVKVAVGSLVAGGSVKVAAGSIAVSTAARGCAVTGVDGAMAGAFLEPESSRATATIRPTMTTAPRMMPAVIPPLDRDLVSGVCSGAAPGTGCAAGFCRPALPAGEAPTTKVLSPICNTVPGCRGSGPVIRCPSR